MSDDIVEWLIDFSEATNNPRCADAADKIIGISSANRRLRAENEKLRNEVMSDYHEGWEEGVKAERERCARVAEQARDDTCDGPVAWSMADSIAAAIRESGE